MSEQSDTSNPFSTPQVDSGVAPAVDSVPLTFGQIAKRVFLDWEKMRLAYIGILAAFTVFVGWSELGKLSFWGVAIVGGIIANLCYFLGPIVDTYLSWLGFRSIALRWIMFGLGLLFTMAGALVAILTLPDQI